MKNPDDGKICRIIADSHILADIGSQIGVEIALPLEAYPILLDPPFSCHLQEEEI